MSARSKKKNRINLLPQKGLASSLSGRVLLWVLSAFRIIVISTEIIVMIAFLSRFWLDAQNTDLNEEIEQKLAVISATQNFEDQFKDAQTRIALFSSLIANENHASKSLRAVVTTMPPDIFLETLSFNNNQIRLSGISPSERSVQQYLANLEGNNTFKEVGLGNIDITRSGSSLISFDITLTI